MALSRVAEMLRIIARRRRPDIVALADRARDAAQWELAAVLYRQALDRNSRDSSIWVQYGHALKESGELRDPEKLAQAETAYRKALSLNPGVADWFLQLGHVLKLQGEIEEAEASYLRAFVLDPSMPYPLDELGRLGWTEAHIAELRRMIASDTHPAATSGEKLLLPSLSHVESTVREPGARQTARAMSVAVTCTELHCLKQPSFDNEVALFVTHSPHGHLKPHVRHYLDSLKRQGVSVILIVNADRLFRPTDTDIVNGVDGIFVRRNEGYDFAGWAHILVLHSELFKAKILYLLNDSVIGPTNDASFGDMLDRLRRSPAGLVGLTENFQRGWHLQSYFLALKRCALSSTALHNFISDIVSYENLEEVVNNLEIRFAPSLKAAGVECETLFRVGNFRDDPTVFLWKYLLRSNFPFVKVKTLSGSIAGVDISDWRAVLAEQGYDISLADRTLAEAEVAPSFRKFIANDESLASR
jgi:tetratricopeptide (TPR) repeat protein